MDFGKVDSKELRKIDFKLPPDPEGTKHLLAKYKKVAKPAVYIGCAKWGRKDWVGKLYPLKTKEKDFLEHYAKHFNSIELNATFYRIPEPDRVKEWKSKVGKAFKFCPKFTEVITHRSRLKDAREVTNAFLKGVFEFEENLGPCFIQLPPNFPSKNFDILKAYLESLPKDLEVFVELRHPDWFLPEMAEKTFSMIEKLKKGSAITDASGRRDCVHQHITIPSTFIRFVGNGLHATDYTRVDDWVKRMKTWLDSGMKSIYFFMHQHDELHSPELCKYVIQEMNKACKLNIPEPRFISDKGLFD
jgi:uncharacterized protein YecE (DUF72 family)